MDINNPKSILIYNSNHSFKLQCRDTYWVESFNNCILIYCPKRIHFADRTFNMRIALAVMDWVSRRKYCTCLTGVPNQFLQYTNVS